jgi:hypothetical protein
MTIMASGIDVGTGNLLIEPLRDNEFAARLVERLPRQWPQAQQLARAAESGTQMRALIARKQLLDYTDPRAVGWTYLVAADEPLRDEIARVLEPLARHRGMAEPRAPLVFSGEPPEDWQDWMEQNYGGVPGETPHYVLIVGGPERVPFHFQAVLDSAASVGRVAFHDISSLEAYVEKVLRLEDDRTAPVTRQEALIFATDRGSPDPTYYSRQYMAKPIDDYLRCERNVPVRAFYGESATAPALLEALTTGRSAVIYTATHGAARPAAGLDAQRETNGAIVCTPEPGATAQSLVAASDIPADTPVAEGAIVFQFGCFSAGTPAESDYAHWLGRERLNAQADFVAALPNRLLSHPRGPVAFVGHVDLAWIHAFDDPDDPDIEESWHPRLKPFRTAVETLLAPQPVGLAMTAMNKRFDVGNAGLANAFDQQRRGNLPDRPEYMRRLVRSFITRSDAQNYIVLGDPAVYPRMSDD